MTRIYIALAILLLAVSHWFTYRAGYNASDVHAERVIAQMAQAEAQAQQKAREAEQAAQDAREEARRKLAAYKPKVVERVRQNPSGCNLPAPVADGLREQVRETNKAIVSASGRAPGR